MKTSPLPVAVIVVFNSDPSWFFLFLFNFLSEPGGDQTSGVSTSR